MSLLLRRYGDLRPPIIAHFRELFGSLGDKRLRLIGVVAFDLFELGRSKRTQGSADMAMDLIFDLLVVE